ncbi:MAG: transglycosylase domain-containing protein [Porphyromonas sp.]|nr:transglycosylase domain-containing protein [Porphyromonas sp.]
MKKGVKKIVRLLWTLFAIGVVALVLLFVLIANGAIGYMPPIEDLQNPIDKYATQVISEDGVVMGSYALKGNNRVYTTYDELSPELVQALIATEDKRYTRHSGIDMRGLFRVFFRTVILRQKNAGGGSTISQQLAKQLYSPGAKNLFQRAMQKPIEWVIATNLERYYSKEEIISLYLNKFDFLYQAVGIDSAAKTYFSKEPSELATEEAAMLVGMCKNPSYYNPVRFPDRAKERRDVVLRLMAEQDYLTKAQYEELRAKPLKLAFKRQTHRTGIAPYLREYLRRILMAEKPDKKNYRGWQAEDYERDLEQWEHNPLYGWCNKNRKPNGEPYNIYTDGLKVYTTINSKMQEHAEQVMLQHIAGDLQKAFDREKKGRSYAPFSNSISASERESIIRRSMVNSDRYRTLKADGMSEEQIFATFDEPVDMTVFDYAKVGQKYEVAYRDTVMTPRDSILYQKKFLQSGFMAMDTRNGYVRAYVGGVDFNTFQYDMATQGRRQVGSTMKPYLYAMAMSEGFTPCHTVLHVQPHIRLATGQIWSPKNAGASRVGEEVTINWGLQTSSNWVTAWLMSQMSPVTFVDLLHSFGVTGELDPTPAISLGSPDISVAEMVSGFSTFANAGMRAVPLYVTRIEDQYGNVVGEFLPDIREVLPADATYKTLHMLRNVMNGGTGSRVRFKYGVQADMGGKTGTSQNHSDGWFMGFTPTISAGCWVGGEDRSIHFDGIRLGQGANMSLPIVAMFYKKIFEDKSLQERKDELGINPQTKFDIPEEYADPCKSKEGRVVSSFEPIEQGIDPLFE